jgi:hypothetical protein
MLFLPRHPPRTSSDGRIEYGTRSSARSDNWKLARIPSPKPFPLWCYHADMYAQKFQVDVLIRGERRPCPLEWLDQFSMRNFTNSADFDDTLPLADGRLEASFRLTPERFAEGLSAWLTQRGKGEGQPVQVEVKLL